MQTLVKVFLILVVGAATITVLFFLHAKITRELARWLCGYIGVMAIIATPIIVVGSGGGWWVLLPITALLLALYMRVDYRGDSVPTQWLEVVGSYKWRALGYGDLTGPSVISAMPDYLLHDEQVRPALKALAEGRVEDARAELEELATSGNAAAMNNLGVITEAGLAGFIGKHDAMKWYRKAAESGKPVAQYNLAILLAGDRPTVSPLARDDRSRDIIEAHRLFLSATRCGFKPAKRALKGLRSRMTKAEIAEAEKATR